MNLKRFLLAAVNVFLASNSIALPSQADLPSWAKGDWNGKDKTYRNILNEVRPYFGKYGFIDAKVVADKWKYHWLQYQRDQSNSLKLMRILAWTEVALSDNNIFADAKLAKMKREFLATYQFWSKPIDSFAFVRTYAMVQFMTSSPDAFVDNRLIEKLYIHDRKDTELELVYIIWCSMNPEVAPNKLTLVKLLEKQEKLEFRKYGRLKLIELGYFSISGYEGRSPELLEKTIVLSNKRLSVLPRNHPDNTREFRQKVKESNEWTKKTIKWWKEEGL